MIMNNRPLLWFALSWVAGSTFAASLGMRGSLLAAGAGFLLAVAAISWKLASPRLMLACLLALAAASGQRLWTDAHNETALVALREAAVLNGPLAAYAVRASGTIVSAVEVDGDRVRFTMEAHSVHGEGFPPLTGLGERIMVQLRLQQQLEQVTAAAWQRGDAIAVAGELAAPAEATNRGGFDYRRYLRSQRIHWLLKGKGATAAQVEPAAGAFTAAALLGRVDAARGWLGAAFDELYPDSQAGYMKGLILGIREDLDPERFGQFSKLGLTHILAISGLHVGVFLYVLGGLLRFARLPKERILLILLFAVPVYVLLTGGSPSVLRAGIMSMLGLAAARMGKLKDGLHLISAAALALLIINPYYLNDVSFQLSFIVTLGLILGVQPLRRCMPAWKKHGWFPDLVAVSVTAQLVSFPVTLYYFNGFHLLSLPANLLLVPFISFAVLPVGSASLMLSLVWQGGAQALASVGIWANDFSFKLVELMSTGVSDQWRLIWKTPPLWWVSAWLLLLLALFRLLGSWQAMKAAEKRSASEGCLDENPFAAIGLHKAKRLRYGLAGLAVVFGLLLFYAYMPDAANRDAVISFLDVGQGDSALIRTPGGKHILIDGGGTISFQKPEEAWKTRKDPFEVGAKVVVPLLLKRGVQHIDLLVVSHLDSDHIRGLAAIAEQIPISAVWWNGSIKEAQDAKSLLQLLLDKKIPLYAPKAGEIWNPDPDTSLAVLWPPAEPVDSQSAGVRLVKDQNEISLVLELETYGKRFLFTGDIGSATERSLMRMMVEGKNEPAGINIMKVAHHGSRFSTASDWLDFWRPAVAVNSAGTNNPYNHPHPDTLGRLREAGVALWRIDQQGEASFRVDEGQIYYWRK
ncbi:DNA internalization-related competence protein ComEC/Rec2 [Paenibacillus sp. CAU 1782]